MPVVLDYRHNNSKSIDFEQHVNKNVTVAKKPESRAIASPVLQGKEEVGITIKA